MNKDKTKWSEKFYEQLARGTSLDDFISELLDDQREEIMKRKICPEEYDYSRIIKISGCNCNHCYRNFVRKWRIVSECGCFCHSKKESSGHSSLCCEYPNTYKKDNPFLKEKK